MLQSETFDPEGQNIRKWVEELKDFKGREIHDPNG
jgi:deoxyribodipyrimidine photo-lyase